jgi:hypothetical protein
MRRVVWGLVLVSHSAMAAMAGEPGEPGPSGGGAVEGAGVVGVGEVVGAEPAQPGPDLDAAKTVAAEAQLMLEGFDGAAAAVLFERANHLDGQVIWLFAAAEAWLVAAEPGRALEHLKVVRESLGGLAPERVEAALALADALVPIVGRARAATLSQMHAAAAVAWGEAHTKRPVGRYRLEQARATVRAGLGALALFEELERRSDLSRVERLEVADALVRLRNPLPDLAVQAVERPSAAPMWMVVGGGALVVGGVVALAVAEGQRADVRASLEREPGGRSMTRAEALATWEQAQTLNAAGWIGGGVGAVLAGSGALLGSVGGLGFQF